VRGCPEWVHDVHSWQQIQIGSAEDDLRTAFNDLPARARQLADHGVTGLQLVGWNQGGQDRGNPSHDPDERLGTWEDLKAAISAIEALGVRVVLFNKFVWADVTRSDYSSFLDSAAMSKKSKRFFRRPRLRRASKSQVFSLDLTDNWQLTLTTDRPWPLIS
jgi:sugar phosphate isomerase/epimerase